MSSEEMQINSHSSERVSNKISAHYRITMRTYKVYFLYNEQNEEVMGFALVL